MRKKIRFLLLSIVVFVPIISIGQISFQNVTSLIMGNSVYPNHNEGYSLVEVNQNSLLLSTSYYTSSYGYLPRIYYSNGVGVTSSYLPPVLGGRKIIKTNDGNFMSIRVVNDLTFKIDKFDFNGNIIWTRERNYGIVNKSINDIIQTSDGGYAITGFFSIQQFSGYYHTFLLKLNSVGEIEWEKFFGDSTEMNEGLSLVETLDQGYALACYSPFTKLNIFKTDSLGNLLWKTPINNGLQVAGGDLDILPDNSLLVTGYHGGQQFLAKINELGVITNLFDYPTTIAGNSFSSIVKYLNNPPSYLFVTDKFVITDTSGVILWMTDSIQSTQYKDIIIMGNGDIMAIGYLQTLTSIPTEVVEKIILTRLSNSGVLLYNEQFDKNNSFEIYPNPNRGDFNIKFNKTYTAINVSIINLLGQIVYDNVFNNEQFCDVKFEGSKGSYFVKVKFDKENEITKKIIIE